VLERLAQIYLAKHQHEAARVFLNRMARDVIHGQRAEDLLTLVGPEFGGQDPWLQGVTRLRELNWTEDFAYQTYPEEFMLDHLLRANRRNRMAFEFLMAWYLLAKRPDGIAANLHRLDDFGYNRIPRHYEEALLLHRDATGAQVLLREYCIRPETIERFREFVQRYHGHRGPGKARSLARDCADTYWLYFVSEAAGTGEPR
jgi:hypothetical protein